MRIKKVNGINSLFQVPQHIWAQLNKKLEIFGNKEIKKFVRKSGILIPFFMIVCVIPIARMHIPVLHNKEMQQVLLKTGGYDDYFHLGKVILLYISTGVLFLVYLLKKDIRAHFPGIFYLLVPYCAFILLSIYFSAYRISALFGVIDHYEGGLTLLCYSCILMFSYYLISNYKQVFIIIMFMLSASVIVAAIGVLQFTGVLPAEVSYTISSSIGNSNYVGTYASLLLPMTITVIMMEPNNKKKVFHLLVFFGSAVFLLFGSMSRAGYMASIISAFLFFIFLWKEICQNYKWIFAAVAYAGVIFILMNTFSKGLLLKEWKSMNPFGVVNKSQEDKLYFEDIQLTDTQALIITNRWVLHIENTGDGFHFFDPQGDPVNYRTDHKQALQFIEEPYRDIMGLTQKQEQFEWLMLLMEGKDIELVKMDTGIKVVGYNGMLTDIMPVESYGFKGRESFASGRGYIWSRSLPLLKKAIWKGYGPNTFTYIFPQNDIVGKLNYGAIWVIVGRPHNWYMQIALGTGILSLLCVLAMIGWVVVKGAKQLYRVDQRLWFLPEKTFRSKIARIKIMSCGILLSVIGFCITGVFNDSVVAVSPVFWMFLGFSMRFIEKARKK